jgi:hypothetical protein
MSARVEFAGEPFGRVGVLLSCLTNLRHPNTVRGDSQRFNVNAYANCRFGSCRHAAGAFCLRVSQSF